MKYFKDREFRCKHCGRTYAYGIKKTLGQLLDKAREALGKPVYVTSGYRCKEHNDDLVKKKKAVKNSRHLYGQAADIRPLKSSKKNLKKLYDIVKELKPPGLGWYPESGFIHVDIRHGSRRCRWSSNS